MIWAVSAAVLAAGVAAALRWLRVAQREHYLPVVTRFAFRWWFSSGLNIALVTFAFLCDMAAPIWGWAAMGVAAAQIGPIGLGLRGRTSKLAFTPRLIRLAVFVGLVFAALLAFGIGIDSAAPAASALLLFPVIVDLGLVVLAPVERSLGSKWVDLAQAKLESVGPRVVAITGSYGKTTTKAYTAHLASGSFRTVASPASFNNRLGLARAINEGLAPGTELFVAEMGTYGPGEIADMCSWVRPEVAAMVSIGPVHLERFGSEEAIVAAKSEILDGARVGVICVDDPLLAELAAKRSRDMEIIEVSARDRGRVRVTEGKLIVDGEYVADVPPEAFSANLAVAVGICLALGMTNEDVARRLGDLPSTPHRQTVSVGEGGFSIIDDTFNSNPAGARRALDVLAMMGGTKAVVTPGMVELGRRQAEENEAFAAAAAAVADHIVVVGRTNRDALLRGAAKGRAAVTVVDTREQAVAWARSNLGPGDAILYENDLPDHYP
ncbi:MAG: UDP-N-acetylmuramoyl-tripeptide--D-alanyl-D-alanine ligase [Acidimicrobiales bacterium]|nr:UDP-N-acetylmuramoyl-tripeptide--D-alanyl-D-alanine ligase [Acidimicrobiales bacterium]